MEERRNKLENERDEMKAKTAKLENERDDMIQESDNLESEIDGLKQIEKLTKEEENNLKNKKSDFKRSKRKIERKKNQIEEQKQQIDKQDERIDKQDERIDKQDERIKEQNLQIDKQNAQIKEQNQQIKEQDQRIDKQNLQIEKQNELIKEQNNRIDKQFERFNMDTLTKKAKGLSIGKVRPNLGQEHKIQEIKKRIFTFVDREKEILTLAKSMIHVELKKKRKIMTSFMKPTLFYVSNMFGTGKTWFGENFLNQLHKILEETKQTFRDPQIDKLIKEIKSYPFELKCFLHSKIILIDLADIPSYEGFEEYLKDRILEQIEFEINEEERKQLEKKKFGAFLAKATKHHDFYIFLDETGQIENWDFNKNNTHFQEYLKNIRPTETFSFDNKKLPKYYYFWEKQLKTLINKKRIHLLCAGKSWNFSLIGQGYLKYKDNRELNVSPTDSYRISLPPFTKEILIQLFKESFISFNTQNTDNSNNNENKNVTYYQYMFGSHEKEKEKEKENSKVDEKIIKKEKVDEKIINYFFEQVLVKTGGTPRMIEWIGILLLEKYNSGEKSPNNKIVSYNAMYLIDKFNLRIKEIEDMENNNNIGKKFKIIVSGYLIEYLRDEPRFENEYKTINPLKLLNIDAPNEIIDQGEFFEHIILKILAFQLIMTKNLKLLSPHINSLFCDLIQTKQNEKEKEKEKEKKKKRKRKKKRKEKEK
ncbi:a-type inclusion protein [Anaeramoeba flamelloides]|uniref:A-type inclusion protein n=1 Tax=Anaeramoeba flamelloides TaxID=1746091 RepID=A0AAV7Z3Y1_9EUKA|nr:a-type inclusion protein [Anaeramoeba flamelloides]